MHFAVGLPYYIPVGRFCSQNWGHSSHTDSAGTHDSIASRWEQMPQSRTLVPSLNKGSAKESSGSSLLPTRSPLPTISMSAPLSWATFMTAFFVKPWQPLHRNAIITKSCRFCYVCKVAENNSMVAVCRTYIYLTLSMRTALSIFCIVSCSMNPLSTVNAKGRSLSSLTNVSRERRNCHIRHWVRRCNHAVHFHCEKATL